MRWKPRANRLNAAKRKHYRPISFIERFSRIALPMLVFVLLFFGGIETWRFLHSRHFFGIDEVVIEGDFRVIKALDLVALLGIAPGDNLLFADLDNLLARLYRHPWVESVEIERRYPHSLWVRVIEEDPIAILAGPHYAYLNREGFPFKEVEKGEEMDFPILILPPEAGGPSSGERVQKKIHEMIDFLNKYEETRFAKEFGVSELIARKGEIICFTKKGGIELQFSREGLVEELGKLERYYPYILGGNSQGAGKIGALDLGVKGKIIARDKS